MIFFPHSGYCLKITGYPSFFYQPITKHLITIYYQLVMDIRLSNIQQSTNPLNAHLLSESLKGNEKRLSIGKVIPPVLIISVTCQMALV